MDAGVGLELVPDDEGVGQHAALVVVIAGGSGGGGVGVIGAAPGLDVDVL